MRGSAPLTLEDMMLLSFPVHRHKELLLSLLLLLHAPPDQQAQECQTLSEQLPVLTLPGIQHIIIPLINSDWKQII